MASRDAGDAPAGRMSWHDLLFAHWPVSSSALRPHVPQKLEIEEFDGSAWIAVVPFLMTGIRLRGVSMPPSLELNVRTYVRSGNVSGVWFFSLDAESRLLVSGARAFFHLNYRRARMTLDREGDRVRYGSSRIHRGAPPAELRASYRPVGGRYLSEPGTLEHWLTERYALFAEDRRGNLFQGDIQHSPWPLQAAEAEFETNSMTAQIGLDLPAVKPLLHYAKSLDVLVWWPRRVRYPSALP